MDVFDLSQAHTGDDLSPLLFDATEYTPLDVFIERLKSAPDRKVKVSNKTLSINGRVVKDSMGRYLSSPGVSSSALKEALKTPLHYLYYKNQTFKPKDTSHFDRGTFIHMAFLEPRLFEKVVVEPRNNCATRDGIIKTIEFYKTLNQEANSDLSDIKMDALREILAEQKEKCLYQVVSEEDKTIIDVVKRSYYVYGGGILKRLFLNAKSEVSMYGDVDGLKVKIRPDAMLLEEDFGENAIISIKSTACTSIEQFMRDAAKYKYELSEGMYLDVASRVTGREFTATIMVMIQTVIPYQTAILYWDAEDLQVGKYKYQQALDVVRECTEKDLYPGFDAKAEEGNLGFIQMKLPEYIKTELLSTQI